MQSLPLWEHATQTVFGEGPADAAIVMIGEQPGDKEDQVGRPFVGPAGKLLDQCLEEAEIDRRRVYVTNAVKHFKWVLQGSRRLHQKPRKSEVDACRPWIVQEIEIIEPEALVCLGATAAQAILGPQFRLTQHRGEFVKSRLGKPVLATVHPSAILRMPDHDARERERLALVEDLRRLTPYMT